MLQETYEVIAKFCDIVSINNKKFQAEDYINLRCIKKEIGEYVNKDYYSNYFESESENSEIYKKILNID